MADGARCRECKLWRQSKGEHGSCTLFEPVPEVKKDSKGRRKVYNQWPYRKGSEPVCLHKVLDAAKAPAAPKHRVFRDGGLEPLVVDNATYQRWTRERRLDWRRDEKGRDRVFLKPEPEAAENE